MANRPYTTTLERCIACDKRFLRSPEHQRLRVLAREDHRVTLCTRCTGQWVAGGRDQHKVERRVVKSILELEASAPSDSGVRVGRDD